MIVLENIPLIFSIRTNNTFYKKKKKLYIGIQMFPINPVQVLSV